MITIQVAQGKKLNDYSMFLSFPYNNEIVEVIRSFPQRYWDKDNKVWELPLNRLGDLLNKLPNQPFDISGKYVEFPKVSAEIPDGFEFKTNPFQHQVDGFKFGLSHDRWLLGDEQGLGKTKQVIDIAIAKRLQRGYKHCLIICGVNGLKWNWVNEIKTHSNEQAYILGQRTVKDKIVIGSSLDKLTDVEMLDSNPAYFIITNIESLRYKEWTGEYRKDRRGRRVKVYKYPITNKLIEAGIDMIAFDECHKAKNPESEQGQQLLRLNAETMIAMTGTPLMNTPLDLYIILKWLGEENHTFYAFKNHYCQLGGFGGYEVIGYKNLNELQNRLNEIMLRRLKNDVLDLPEKLHINEYVEMSNKQWQIYNAISSDIKENIDKIKAASNPLAELIRLRQATGYTGILSSTVKESAKLDHMEELVEETLQNGKKVVIFSNWTQVTDVVYDRLIDKYSVGLITGETPDNSRQAVVNDFQYGNIDVMIGTIGAMGTGLTLTAGTVEIFMDEPWTMAAKEQAEDRCHRVGTTENITIYTLMCKGTIDERINELVMKKGAMADALIDGKTSFNRPEIIDFLLS